MKSAEQLRETILELAIPLIEAEGLELWGLDIIPGGTLKVALYVEEPQSEESTGASIDQCESISRQLSLAMDVEDCIDQPWTLEVSSPGLERRFFRLDQMRPYIGEIIEARVHTPVSGRKRWLGRLLAVGDDSFELEPVAIDAQGQVHPDGEAASLPFGETARANLVYLFQAPQKPGKPAASRKKK